MRDDNYYSSVSMSDYIHWVMRDKLYMTDKEIRDWYPLMEQLCNVEFVWNHPMDENRAFDGLELRSDFEYESGDYLDNSSGLMPKCTVFEMLAALAIRCEDQLMYNSFVGDRTSKWFFEMIHNLNLKKNSKIDEGIAEDIIEGMAFPLKNSKIKQKNEQIWKQLSAYLKERYMSDGQKLDLFDF